MKNCVHEVVYINRKIKGCSVVNRSGTAKEAVESFHDRVFLADVLNYKLQVKLHPKLIGKVFDNGKWLGYYTVRKKAS